MFILDATNIEKVLVIGSFIAVGVVGKRAGWFKIIGGTNALLKEQNAILTEQNITLKTQLKTTIDLHNQEKKEWGARHQESLTEISKLQGKVETLTALPLNKIDNTLKEFTSFGEKFVKSNDKILKQLQISAKVAKNAQSDGGLLVKTKETNPLDVKPVKGNNK